MTTHKPPRDIADLSFVKSKRNGRRCFWHVRSTGDDCKDEKLGQRVALEYLAYQEADTGVADMPRKLGPIEISFLTLVSYAAGAGAYKARRVAAYWDSCWTQSAA
jgi:hypothetical protein